MIVYPLVITMKQYEPISSNLDQCQPILTTGEKLPMTMGISNNRKCFGHLNCLAYIGIEKYHPVWNRIPQKSGLVGG
jgi:hypothetical protein